MYFPWPVLFPCAIILVSQSSTPWSTPRRKSCRAERVTSPRDRMLYARGYSRQLCSYSSVRPPKPGTARTIVAPSGIVPTCQVGVCQILESGTCGVIELLYQ
ncbi:hypothetical protein EDB83DRAFT_2415509 [Lactarius deliciosus]|nr:hypothetical protein EDB83DRAFT_2415509 [Lactarius deliciosus]